MSKISAVVLSYNNEKEIGACLDSLSWADEVVLVDSFSDDKTVEIAKEKGAIVHQHPFSTFGALRNIAHKYAKYDWVFSLDTDEVATAPAIDELKKIANDASSKDIYFVPRRNIIFGKKMKHGGWYPDYRQPQFFKKDSLVYQEEHDVHEGFTPMGSIGYLKSAIEQRPFRDLEHYLAKMERYSTLMAKRMNKEGRRFSWPQLIVRPVFSFIKRYFFRLGLLDGLVGFIFSCFYAHYTFTKYAKLWLLQKRS